MPKAAVPPVVQKSRLDERLRAARQFAGLTQSDIAEVIGKGRSAVAQHESPNEKVRKSLDVEEVRAWARRCGVSELDLFDDNVTVDELLMRWRDAATGNPPAVRPTRPAPAGRPRNAGVDIHAAIEASDRLTAWRQGIMYDCMTRDTARAAAFDVPLRAHGVELVAPYLHQRTLIAFAGWDSDTARLYSTAVARLLLLESAAHRGRLSKHLILLSGQGKGEGKAAVDFGEPVFGVHLHVVDSVQAATDLVMSLG